MAEIDQPEQSQEKERDEMIVPHEYIFILGDKNKSILYSYCVTRRSILIH